VAPDDIGGAYIGWAHRLVHVQAGGGLDAPGIDGIELIPGSEQNSYKMISDGTGRTFPAPVPGGVFAAWSTAGGQLVAQRVNAGLRWGSPGLVVATHGAILGYDLAQDGSGGIVICWVARDGVSPYRYTVRAQRLDVNGSPLWSSGGVIIIDSDVVSGTYNAPNYSAPAIARDGNGGAIVAWCDTRNYSSAPSGCTNGWTDLYAQRVDAGGSVVWNSLGVLLPPYLCGDVAPGGQGEPRIVPDSRNGAIVAYDDLGGWDWDIAGTRLNGNGFKLWSQWIRTDGTSPSDRGLVQHYVKLAFDASGGVPKGALLVWDEAGTGGHHRVYVQKVEVNVTIPANDTCSGATALAENVYYSQSTVNANDDGYSSCLGRTRAKGVWFTYTPAISGTATVDTCPSGFDTMVEVFTGTCAALTSIACNDDSVVCGFYKSATNFTCTAGTTCYIWAGGYNGAVGNLQIRARLNTTAAIILTNVQYSVSQGLRFTVLGAPGDEYIVFGSTNFLDWFQLNIISNVTGAVEFTDPASLGLTRRFYRCKKP
jgi:hypothetical protein